MLVRARRRTRARPRSCSAGRAAAAAGRATACSSPARGVLDVSATGLYALAQTLGSLSVVSVVGSLYPVTTVLLARSVLGERLRRVQAAGVVLALAGVALIAAG